MQAVNDIIIQTLDVLDMTTVFTRGVTTTDGVGPQNVTFPKT